MGTITFEFFAGFGAPSEPALSVARLDSLISREQDATTSTTAESVSVPSGAKQVTIRAVELHRVSTGDSAAATTYAEIPAGESRDFGIDGAETDFIYYRLDS